MGTKNDLGASFNKLKDSIFFTYRGVTFEKVATGWKRGDIVCRNREEMDSLIDKTEQLLNSSINRVKNENSKQ